MSKKQAEGRAKRQRFMVQFKQQALLRAVKDGVSVTARDLGIQPTQLYPWRAHRPHCYFLKPSITHRNAAKKSQSAAIGIKATATVLPIFMDRENFSAATYIQDQNACSHAEPVPTYSQYQTLL